MKLNKLVKKYRESLKMTQTEFAKKNGVTRATVSLWEKGTIKHLPNTLVEELIRTYKPELEEKIEPKGKILIREVLQKHILTVNSFIDKDGNNRFEDCVENIYLKTRSYFIK